MDDTKSVFGQFDFVIEERHLRKKKHTLILRKAAISRQYFMSQNLRRVLSSSICVDYIGMLGRIMLRLSCGFGRTRQQEAFLDSLPRMKFTTDEELISNIRDMYDRREFLQDCEGFRDVSERIEGYLLKTPKCTVAHLQCYYKLKEMHMVASPFRHNLTRKYHRFLLRTGPQLRNEHLQKFLWFLFDEAPFERALFHEAGDLHTLALFEVHEYMSGLRDMPTWEPFVRVTTMLRAQGHEVAAHRGLANRKILQRLAHRYYPYVARLFTAQQMRELEKEQKYDLPFLTHLCQEYILRNVSQYDSYLQRVEAVELEQVYERVLDVMVWSEFPMLLQLAADNFEQHGSFDDIENRIAQIFFRLCENADIDLETVAAIQRILLERPHFMSNHRFPLLARCSDSIFKRSLEDFNYLPAEAFEVLLKATNQQGLDMESKARLQKFLCKKVQSKLVWNLGEPQKLREFVQQSELEGGLELAAYMRELETKY